ncbi:uncharacterized protein LOC133180866 [Saccostrea echinata]|uniref:uncharacterized protein LOC133180866 n=1 Tax=Saccostrea echinata TaxID=191078 RepID=UPI002A831517|nr:uncharacterized protein LOC133180866 [Saccostrea echinata]
MLRYYHDAGKVLYFNEKDLEKSVIMDVQWFIDAFKHIITDKLHLKDGYNIVLSVTAVSIQLQIFPTEERGDLEKDKTYDIQDRIEAVLNDITGTFHRKISFVRGFKCQEQDKEETIAMDIEGHFLPENDIRKGDHVICPLHSITDRHFLNTNELTKYWKV